MIKYFLLFIIGLSSLGCKDSNKSLSGWQLSDSKVLCKDCQSPNICKAGKDKLFITYIKGNENDIDSLMFHTYENDIDSLMFHTYENGILSKALTIASGDNWFVNWADIPSIVSLDKKGEKLMAHWLQMSAEGTYDYDIRYAISNDGGSSWCESKVLHDDKVSAEHGFVTLVSDSKGAFATWLDGRNTKTPSTNKKEKDEGKHGHDDHGHGGNLPMTLRAAWIDETGTKSNDLEIDNKVCDCCQTDAVITNSGPVVVFRDRSDEEIRDISVARFREGQWTHKVLHNDNWHIAGCPVNGPAIAYENGILAVAWYTQMNELPKIYMAISRDDGNTFESPILIAKNEVIGRVDVAMINDQVVVTWVEKVDKNTFVSSRIINISTSVLFDANTLLSTSDKRSSGFPIVEIIGDQMIMARTTTKNEELSISLEVFDGI